jgi:anti-sigma factor RsiW
MSRFSNPCRRHRKSLCLLAGGLLSAPDRASIENHLAGCARCRSYYEEIKSVAIPLAGWERHFAHVEPGAAVQMRLAKAIAAAGKSESVRPLMPKIFIFECWRQLIWPSRRIWAGLAAVWILLLAANFSLRDRSPAGAMASASPEMIMAWQQQERLLAELIGPNEPRATAPAERSASPPDRPKPSLPRSSGERLFEMMTA